MFPKSTLTTTVAMSSPEKNGPMSDEKDVAIVYMVEDKNLQVSVDDRNRRWAYCACAVVLTSLILVAGTLGTVTLVLTHNIMVTSDAQPFREQLPVNNSFAEISEAPPRVQIDDGGLWPPEPMTPDLNSDDIQFGDDDIFPDPPLIPYGDDYFVNDEVGRPPEVDEQASGDSFGDGEGADHEESEESYSTNEWYQRSYPSESSSGVHLSGTSDMYHDSDRNINGF